MMSLQELQLLAEREYTIQNTRQDLNRLVEFFRGLPNQGVSILAAFIQERMLPKEVADAAKVFFIDENMTVAEIPEEFRAESLGMIRQGNIIFSGRLVYPVMDVKGDVAGFCGWDKFVQPKYLDSKNQGYLAKANMFYGMEKMQEYYDSDRPLYVVEGIVCCLYLRSKGFNAVAILGSKLTLYMIQILKRFKMVVIIPDNDVFGKNAEELGNALAGEGLVQQAKRTIRNSIVVQSIIAKDVDDSRKIEDKESLFCEELKSVGTNPFQEFKTIRVR